MDGDRALRSRTPAIPWRPTAFLMFYFLLTFLPFLKVFKEQVHLAYCLIPASILLAASVEALWREAAAVQWAPRLVVAGLLLIVVGDHAINPFVVRAATRDCYAAIGRVTATCVREMPPGSILLSNAHHAADVCLLAQGRFALNYTVMSSGRRDLLIDTPAALTALRIAAGEGESSVSTWLAAAARTVRRRPDSLGRARPSRSIARSRRDRPGILPLHLLGPSKNANTDP